MSSQSGDPFIASTMPSPLWCQKSSGSTSCPGLTVQVTEREMF